MTSLFNQRVESSVIVQHRNCPEMNTHASSLELGEYPDAVDDRSAVRDEAPPEDAVSQVDVPPNGGYAWVCTACVFLINAHTWGVNSVSPQTLTARPRLISLGLGSHSCLFSFQLDIS